MSTGRVSPSSPMLELVRTLAAGRAGKNTVRAGTLPSPSARPGGDRKVLRKRLSDLAQTINLEDTAAVTQMRRTFLKEIILWEFGAEFRLDPEFGPMLATLERTFEADPRMLERFAALLRELRKGG